VKISVTPHPELLQDSIWIPHAVLAKISAEDDLPHPRTARGWQLKLANTFPRKKIGREVRTHISALPADIQASISRQAAQMLSDAPEKVEILHSAQKRRGRPRGSSRLMRDEDIVGLVVSELEENPELSIKIIHERLVAMLGEQRAGPLRTVQWMVRRYKQDNASALTLITRPNAWRNKHMAATGSRSEQVIFANQLWEIDSTPTDIMVAGKRHNLVVVVDVFTRRVMTILSRTSNSRAIAELLRRAIRAWGRPLAIKMDNGKDYKSEHIQRGLKALGITVIFCTPYSPQEKPHVERVNHYIQHDLMPAMPGYVGWSVATRREIDERNNVRHRDVREVGTSLALDQVEQFLDSWATAHNATHEHSAFKAAGLGNITPDEMARRCPSPKIVIDDHALHLFLEPVGGLKSVGKQHIRHEHGYYSAPELVPLTGQRVRVRVSDYDAGHIFVFDADDDTFICTALDPEIAGISRAAHTGRIRAAERDFKADVRSQRKQRREQFRPQNIAAEVLNARLARANAAGLGDNVISLPRRENTASTDQTKSLETRHAERNRQTDQVAALQARLGGARRFYGHCMAAVTDDGEHDFYLLNEAQWRDLQRLSSDAALTSLIDRLKNEGEIPVAWNLPAILTLMKRRTA
jgi:transposase InsO family protein